MGERLLTYVYQFGGGALVYAASLTLLLRTGALGETPGARRRHLALLLGLALAYAVGQGFFQFVAPHLTCQAGGLP